MEDLPSGMSKKRVAIIGAGASGLTAIKCCLDEGLEPVCFERSSYIGGLWHYTDEVEDGQACVMKSTVINTSKEMMCYSDYKIPADFAIYMHNTKVDQYLNMYADHFDLRKYIQLNTEVVSVTLGSPTTGVWEITTRDSQSCVVHTFDAVLICTGHHAQPNIPRFTGLEKFKGKVVHSRDFKNHKGYEDKRVVIVGIGNSGGDVATELSRISSQIYLSTRSGAWIHNRVAGNGDPVDMRHVTRFKWNFINTFPNLISKLAILQLNMKFDHDKFGLKPRCSPLGMHATVNDELPNRIVSGGVIVKANVREFSETGVLFEDGTLVEDIDAVVFATGYVFGFPFLDKEIIEVKDNKVDLYQFMFPPNLDKPTLAVIGCFQALGANMPASEMQCRLATRVFKNIVQLPDREEMLLNIRCRQEAMALRYMKSTRHTIQVDYIALMDELASVIGCKPDFRKLFITDPKLAAICYFGPSTSYQFRLMGPGAWKGARDAILTQWERTYQPLRTRDCGGAGPETNGFRTLCCIFALIIIWLLAYCCLR